MIAGKEMVRIISKILGKARIYSSKGMMKNNSINAKGYMEASTILIIIGDLTFVF
jgi:uncharacterized protein (UPF0216 family)